jgi:hypothetical protein
MGQYERIHGYNAHSNNEITQLPYGRKLNKAESGTVFNKAPHNKRCGG